MGVVFWVGAERVSDPLILFSCRVICKSRARRMDSVGANTDNNPIQFSEYLVEDL